ncbi:hypothetical protein [Vibrio cholerae]|uniref:hypothetical protein n=3 Tax=Vibrio cholerae TaxID=666 RepID=UPI000A1F8463|nr:hypothetical protein [Vibrio cholerae]OSP48590.1 hypothetical protein B7937_00310 [Vibrio cholerae]RGP88824.1 hypothetical protein BC354_02335 [Vibrio cholerae]RGP95007.1 hypothetical protein BC352_02330 [Vibrio cholerae]
MFVNLIENNSYYSLEITSISASDKEEAIILINEFYSSCDKNPIIELLSDEYSEYKGSSIPELKASLGEINFEESITIKINLDKDRDCGKVYNEKAFVSWLKKLDIQEQIKQIATYFNEKNIRKVFSTEDFTAFCSYKKLRHTEHLNQIANDNFNSGITPYYFEWLIFVYNRNEILMNYFKQLRNLFSIACICDDKERDYKAFYLSRDKSIGVDDIYELTSEQSNHLFNIFRWVFEDDNFRLKCSISCNILSIQSSFSSSLNKNILPLLKSNLNIVFKENFNSYIEARASVMSYLFELSTKLSDQINNTKSSLNNCLLVILSFFFTSIVFTAIDKGKLENIFTYEISILSSFFIICSMIYLTFNQLETEYTTEYYLKQKNEFMKKYQNIFSIEELNDLFNPPSIVDIFKRAKSRIMFYTYQIIMVILTILTWYLYELNI